MALLKSQHWPVYLMVSATLTTHMGVTDHLFLSSVFTEVILFKVWQRYLLEQAKATFAVWRNLSLTAVWCIPLGPA